MENFRNVGFFLNLGIWGGGGHATQQAMLSAHKGYFFALRMELSCFRFLLFPCRIVTLRHEKLSTTMKEVDDISNSMAMQDSHFHKASFRAKLFSLNNDNFEVWLRCLHLSFHLLTTNKAEFFIFLFRRRAVSTLFAAHLNSLAEQRCIATRYTEHYSKQE